LSDALRNGLLLAGLGFVLTTVVGGLLGTFLQSRLWQHQWGAQRTLRTTEAAQSLFEDVSRLMDRRLYRLSQLGYWTSRPDSERREEALRSYREVVREWNDSINRNLSLLEFYFGHELRESFDSGVGREFVEAGELVEALYRLLPETNASLRNEMGAATAALRSSVYTFNLNLLSHMDMLEQLGRPRFFLLAAEGGRRKAVGDLVRRP
jgi:hypothetical protein